MTPTPPTKSMSVLPSTSVIVEPRASAATTGACTISGRATARRSRSRISRERGPGISVRSSMTRVAAMRAAYSGGRTGILSRDGSRRPRSRSRSSRSASWLEDAAEASPQPDAMVVATATPRRTAVGARRPSPRPRRARARLLHEPELAEGPRARREPAGGGRPPLVRARAAGARRRRGRGGRRATSRRRTGRRRPRGEPARGLGLAAVAAAREPS